MPSTQNYALPRRTHSASGEKRQVGFELEFAGLDLRHTVSLLERVFDESAHSTSLAEARLTHARWGDFKVEVDSELAKSLAKTRARWREEARARGELKAPPDYDPLAEWLVNLTTELVPVEVVCPPVDIDQLADLDPLVDSLRAAGALGTSESLLYAFGVHINPDLPALDAQTVARYLRAFALAQDWLLEVHRVDLSRRFVPYIDLYSGSYRKKILGYDDRVSMDTLIDDYLHFNATRNRALDMLPLFKHIDEARISAKISDVRVKARPTFHYRMPNCEINRPGWRLANSWNPWCVVEALADSPELLDDLSAQFRRHDGNLLNLRRPAWHQTLDQLLHDLASA
tara:strand:- start:35416 stop:36444 length:1029 start_codon:yes stop_codon:yes gene_type:complete